MSNDSNKDLIAIKEWMSKEAYLPQDFDDEVLKKFLHSCLWSLESTKKCLDRFCTTRSEMTEVYTTRDPSSSNVQTSFSAMVITGYEYGKEEILIHKYDDPTLEKFIFYDLLKTISIKFDHWIKYGKLNADGHYAIVDMKYYSLRMVTKINLKYTRDYLLFLLEAMPVRLKKILVVNAPSFYDKLYALVKPVLPAEVCKVIHFFPDHESLYQFIDKKYLPSEYGGEAQSMYERSKEWEREIEQDRKFFLNHNLWKADLKKKPKNTANETMNGSFKTLSID